ncbi:hypothetical protein [Glycomyces buryatensis]|uniref:Uncharacterized protein n=1 Tax=Glycomyces buryatensis TaxID=2570927 RepID=A0A4S8QJQ5_9ACTN|nr:hypothetical protein [Glycomyces buryatensis]THV41629.1 hypothetical protein FAB82_11050 [Glycomyces buryatensis]
MRRYRSRDDASSQPRPLWAADNAVFALDDDLLAGTRKPIGILQTALSQKPQSTFAEPGIAPRPGEGILSLLSQADATAPVIVVDGRPVACGAGQFDLALPAGTHSVEVQGTRTADPVVVRIAEGAVARVGYFEDPASGDRALGDFPEQLEKVGDNSGCLVWLIQAWALVAVLWGLVEIFVNKDTVTGVVVFASIALVALICLPASRRAKRTHFRKRLEKLRPPPRPTEPYPWDARGGSTALLLGAAADVPVPAGAAAIDLELHCRRHLWTGRRKNKLGTFLARTWTRPPRVEIDGVVQPASWGRWRYAVPPGPHRVAVTVDGTPLNLTIPTHHTGETAARTEVDTYAGPGTATRLRAEAHVYAIWRPRTGRIESFGPRLHVEAAQ